MYEWMNKLFFIVLIHSWYMIIITIAVLMGDSWKRDGLNDFEAYGIKRAFSCKNYVNYVGWALNVIICELNLML